MRGGPMGKTGQDAGIWYLKSKFKSWSRGHFPPMPRSSGDRAPAFEAERRRFESCRGIITLVDVAQLVERLGIWIADRALDKP